MSTNKIGFNNFKAFGEKMQTFSKKPITLVYGPNSIGKSSFLHSQLYFEYIKESGKFDLNSTKFAGDEFDLNGFDNFVHKKDTKNSINFKKVITDKDEIFNLLNMFSRGLTRSEIQLLISTIKTTDDILKLLNNLDKDTYRHYSILDTIELANKFITAQKELDDIVTNQNLQASVYSEEFTEDLTEIKDKIRPLIKEIQEILIVKFTAFEIIKNPEYTKKNIKEYDIKDFKKEMGLSKIKAEDDDILAQRMLEIYIEKWLIENKDTAKIDDIELSIFKLMYSNINSLKDEEKENIAKNLMHEIEFLNYIAAIDNLEINFEIVKSYMQDTILNISYNIDGQELFQAVQEGENHKIIINKNNKLLLSLDKKYESFVAVRNIEKTIESMESMKEQGVSKEEIENYKKIKSTRYNLLNETKNFSMPLLWSKVEKKILNKMQIILNEMFVFSDSISWESKLKLSNPTTTLFSPLVLNTLLNIINDEKIQSCQYFGPLRFYPNRTEHLVRTEINSNENLSGKNIWEYIKNSNERQNSLNEILSNKDIFNTPYKVEVQKKLNLISSQIESLDFDNKTTKEIVHLLSHIAKVENELIFIDTQNNTPVTLRDMGLGNSQMIPFLLLCNHEIRTKFFIEQPELHLHPKVQAELADEFIRSYKKGDNEFMIETHSEHLLLRIMRRMRDTAKGVISKDDPLYLTPDDVCLLYVDNDGDSTYIKELRLSKKGKLLDHWPGGFFEEGYKERFL